MKRKIFYSILILFIISLAGCIQVNKGKKDPIEKKKEDPIVINYDLSDKRAADIDSSFVDHNNEFALKIFKELLKDEEENVFISPFSISMALSMALNGANGETYNEMRNTLEFDGMTLEEINSKYLELQKSLEGVDNTLDLNIANSIWIRELFEVKQGFKDRNIVYFDSEVYTKDFSNSEIVTEINNWISEATNGLIEEMIKEVSPEAMLYLINAIYFKGEWKYQFKPEDTIEKDFHVNGEQAVTVDMMKNYGDFEFYQDEKLKLLRLPYGRDKVSMYFVQAEDDLDVLIDGMTMEGIEAKIDNLYITPKLNIEIPKFKVEYGIKELKDALINLGMEKAFAGADFSNISDTG